VKRPTLFMLLMVLWLLAGCQPEAPLNPDVLPADYDYAAGSYPDPVTLNGITLRINQARVVAPDASLIPGYVYVVVNIGIANQSNLSVQASEFQLIDEYLNLYESWQISVPFGQELTAVPQTIGPGDTIQGDHAFLVPAPALQASLRLRWQSPALQSRIDPA